MPIRPPDNVQETRFTMGKKEAIIFDDLASSIESYNKNKLLLSAGKVGLGAIAVIGGVAGAYFVGRGLAGTLESVETYLEKAKVRYEAAEQRVEEQTGDYGEVATPFSVIPAPIRFQKWIYDNIFEAATGYDAP